MKLAYVGFFFLRCGYIFCHFLLNIQRCHLNKLSELLSPSKNEKGMRIKDKKRPFEGSICMYGDGLLNQYMGMCVECLLKTSYFLNNE